MTGVADDALGRFARQQHDWFERVRKGSLNPEEVANAVQVIIDRGSLFKYDKRRDGWEMVEDVKFTLIDPANLELISILKPGEQYIGGEEAVRRARTDLHSNLDQRQAEYLLEHQHEIPEEFRKYYLVFTGTIWRSPGGYRSVSCLRWDGWKWFLYFRWLGHDLDCLARLVRPREKAH